MKAPVLILTAVAAASIAQAQMASNTRITVKVPFEFTHIDKTMPAGAYQITAGPASNTVTLANDTGKSRRASQFGYRHVKPSARGYVRFNCYEGSRCFMSEVAGPYWDHSVVMPAGKIEKELRAAKTTVSQLDVPLAATPTGAE